MKFVGQFVTASVRSPMLSFLLAAVAAFLMALALPGCNASLRTQAAAADAVARGATALAPELVAAQELEDARAIEQAATEADARAALVVIEERWKPVWIAFAALAAAQNAWAAALEQGKAGVWTTIVGALCALAKQVAAVAPALEKKVPLSALPIGEVCP